MVAEETSICVFSDDRVYRYVLIHRVDHPHSHEHKGLVNFIMLNPSTADEQQLDATLRRCRGFARQWGYGTFTVTNLFAFRATDPFEMRKAVDPIGPDNDRHIVQQANAAGMVILAWGSHGKFRDRSRQVKYCLQTSLKSTTHVFHLGMTAGMEPRHPLYLPIDSQPVSMFP